MAEAVVPSTRMLSERVRDRLATLLILLAALAAAEFLTRTERISNLILAPPTRILTTFVDIVSTGYLWPHLWSTILAMLGGFLIAAVLAIGLAGIMASVPTIERVFFPFVIALQTLPKIAVAPLIILWLGFDNLAKTVIVVIICFFPILINSIQGFRIRDRGQFDLFSSLGASRSQLFFKLRVPNALPYIFAGLHISILFGLIGAIVAEFVGSRAGLGFALIQAKAQFNVSLFWAIIVVLIMLGTVLNRSMDALESRVMTWSDEPTESVTP